MEHPTPTEWRELLTLVLAQRLELNAIESALKRSKLLTNLEIQAIRKEAVETAKAWSSREDDDVMALIRIHSSPAATMQVPPVPPMGIS
jgi:hypothetical protein